MENKITDNTGIKEETFFSNYRFSVDVKGEIGTRFFKNRGSALIGAAIYDELKDRHMVEPKPKKWERYVRFTLRLLNSKDKW